MDAIVYTSNTGSTKRYAELLSQMIGLPAFALGDAKDKLSANAGIIYLGWIMASGVKGYSAAAKRYKIHAVCGVGKALENKADRTEEEDDMLDMMLTGSERVKAENLSAVLEWYEGAKA